MADTFEGLGITGVLLEGAGAAGWAAPTGLQRDALPVIRRGNNVVLHASPGAGVTGAFGLGLLDRLVSMPAASHPGDRSPRVLVLVADGEAATRTAESLAALARGTGLAVRALAPGWPPRAADVLVASATRSMAAIQDSSLKLDALTALVVRGADQLEGTDQWAALETVLEATPPEAQRVLVTGRFDPAIDGLIERHVRKAMTIPPRPTEAPATGASSGPPVRFVVVPEHEKTAAVVALIGAAEVGETAIVCRTDQRARDLTVELAARGLPAETDDGGPGDDAAVRLKVLPRHEADRRSTRAGVISGDVPVDSDELSDLHGRGGTVLVTPRQLAHLRRIATSANVSLEAVSMPAPTGMEPLDAIRANLRKTARDADLAADLALIEPLLVDFPAPVLAAAALHLARTGAAHAAGSTQATGRFDPAASRDVATPSAPPPAGTWVRLFVGAGARDGLSAGDLVGAITGETDLPGGDVGKIEIRESHSTVEVPGAAAEAVIRALNGRTLRGRSLRVDYDRKDRSQGRPPARSGPPRGGTGRGGTGRGGTGRTGPPRGGKRPGGRGGSRPRD